MWELLWPLQKSLLWYPCLLGYQSRDFDSSLNRALYLLPVWFDIYPGSHLHTKLKNEPQISEISLDKLNINGIECETKAYLQAPKLIF